MIFFNHNIFFVPNKTFFVKEEPVGTPQGGCTPGSSERGGRRHPPLGGSSDRHKCFASLNYLQMRGQINCTPHLQVQQRSANT